MSFADYGYNVFPFNSQEDEDVLEICGDCVLPKNIFEGDSGKSCYHVIIEHLIDLGSYTENELAAARKELEKFKTLRLTWEQIEQLKNFGLDFNQNEDIGCSRALITINLNDSSCNENSNQARNVSQFSSATKRIILSNSLLNQATGISLFCKNSDLNCRSKVIDEESFRATIIQKDSEIISLKNENAAKEMELRELEEQNKDLELIKDKLKDEIDLLESSSRISQSQIERIVKQKNKEIQISRESSERLGQELQEERKARIHVERKIEKLQKELQEAHSLRKNLSDELNTMKRRVQMLECSNATNLARMKQLQIDRDSLYQENCENVDETEKLLDIIEGTDEKYRTLKVSLSVREQKLGECRNQLETMQREVGKLIGDLVGCLGAEIEEDTEDVYARARELTRGLIDVVKEHEQCWEQRVSLIKEIDRHKAINQDRDTVGTTEIESANRELARLKRAVTSLDDSKVALKKIGSDVIVRMDSRRFKRTEQACQKLASEASQALQKLDQTISEHEVYRKCESFLLLELENLQEALNGAERTISGTSESFSLTRLEKTKSGNNSIVESVLSKQLVQRVQTSKQIVVRITSALREDSISKTTYNKKLEEQLQQALAAVNEVGVEKCQLENECNECRNRCRELDAKVEKLQAELTEKSKDCRSVREKMQARLDHFRKENDALSKRLTLTERLYQDSRSENAALHKEAQNHELKLQEYSKMNDYLNSKVEEVTAMLAQQERAFVQETMRSVDLDGFGSRYDTIIELQREKEELWKKLAIKESQLANQSTCNEKLQMSLSKIHEENKFLEKVIESLKRDNERMEQGAINGERINLVVKCDKLLDKIESINKLAKPCQKTSSTSYTDTAVRGFEKEIKSYKEKLRYQEKELLMKEKEIVDQNQKIEQLQKARDEISPLRKRLEALTREKCQIEDELKQMQIKYEDKLAKMYKQYEHSKLELLKRHNESIKQLEDKYAEMAREEEIGSQTWLQTLSASEMQTLHDKICKSQACPSIPFERDHHEEQRKATLSSKASVSSYGSKRPLPAKKDWLVINWILEELDQNSSVFEA
ncbi:myosin-9-like [Phymastichus coffea]|uniref:myosin-9-like n=1 Tax=Phymastichus coffea TaxID=108790 RepID=UPI00273B0C41|nr:myosin-9-like [Phymastichus coffea]